MAEVYWYSTLYPFWASTDDVCTSNPTVVLDGRCTCVDDCSLLLYRTYATDVRGYVTC